LPSARKVKIQATTGEQIQVFEIQVFSPGKVEDSFTSSKLNAISSQNSTNDDTENSLNNTAIISEIEIQTPDPTKGPTLMPTKNIIKSEISQSTQLIPTQHTPYTCQGVTPISPPNPSQPKYLIWYPRAGMGNVLVSYVSSVMYACLTGRILKIAPYAEREKDVFDCKRYYDDQVSGFICQDLEMDNELTAKYKQSMVAVKNPEAWDVSHCPRMKQHLQYFLCDDGLSEEEFIAVSSCQYWGDLFYSNPYFKDKLPSGMFGEVIRGRLAPSVAVKQKMVQDGPYEVCVHVRWDVEKTKSDLGNDWVNNLGTCVRSVLSRLQDNSPAKKEVMLFTMHQDVREAIKSNLEGADEHYPVHFASEVNPDGGLGLSSDKYAGIADMFSMGRQCVNLLPSREESTYFLIGANLMEDMRVFPGYSWIDGCLEGSELAELNPSGDFWNKGNAIGGGNGDVCKLRQHECPLATKELASTELETAPKVQLESTESVPVTVQSGESKDKPGQDDKCKRMFEWSMMDRWQSDGKQFDLMRLPETKRLSINRMGGPSATGIVQMTITVRNPQLNLTVVDLTGDINDLKSRNVWHHHTALYGTWVGVQIARQKFHLLTTRTVYVHSCEGGYFGGDLPMEWQNVGEISCDRSLMNQADVLINPPSAGLMWDLAWDFDFECQDSDMFKSYATLFNPNRGNKLEPTEAMGCWISREGAKGRTIVNLDDVLKMMQEVFPRVEEIVFSYNKTANETSDMIRECRVLFGIHGAGHTNAIYARPGVGVVEAIGKDNPAYYRNINMLLNQNYQSIVGDPTKKIQDESWVINVDEARAALIKARDHAAKWIEEHGHWRL
jgi:hypothetical protein